MKQLNNKKGFTLIEVVLVLAIGGLIFLLAFVAFQQVSTNRRDTQRRSDAGRVVAELQNYFGDNRSYPNPASAVGFWSNAIPATPTNDLEKFVKHYMNGSEFKDPKGQPVYVTNNAANFGYVSAFAPDNTPVLYSFNKNVAVVILRRVQRVEA